MSFPPAVAESALVACGRCCCLCHKFCGGKIELNHIEPEGHGGPNTFENCIPVCFDCHADIGHYNLDHPRGRKYTASELRGHRDSWYAKVRSSGGPTASEAHVSLDQILFRKTAASLPIDGSMAFVNDLDVETPFEFKRLRDLVEFERLCGRPDVEFMDADLEAARRLLVESASHFHHILGVNTFPRRNSDQNELPSEWHYEQPQRYWKVLNELLAGKKALRESFSSFVKVGRRKLGINYLP